MLALYQRGRQLDPTAIANFVARHRALLWATYMTAWRRGVAGYDPDSNPDRRQAAHEFDKAAIPVAIAILLGRRKINYVEPAFPDPARMQRSMEPALRSIQAMADELSQLVPSPADVAAAQAAVAAGQVAPEAQAAYAMTLAAAHYIDANTRRMDLGDSVAWAGEQAGYAEAADRDGQLFSWNDAGDERVCPDCLALAALPPMPLHQWPSIPGDGATECNVGCRCTLEDVRGQDALTNAANLSPYAAQLLARLRPGHVF